MLAAAAESIPDRPVLIIDRWVPCAELEVLAQASSKSLLAAGYTPSIAVNMPSLVSFAEMIRAMGAVRVGLLLTRRDVAVPSPAQSTPDAEVISSMVWSQTPAAELEGTAGLRVVTHGELLSLAQAQRVEDPSAGWLHPLVELLGAIIDAGATHVDAGNGSRSGIR
jgi:hypothetical protein